MRAALVEESAIFHSSTIQVQGLIAVWGCATHTPAFSLKIGTGPRHQAGERGVLAAPEDLSRLFACVS